MTAAKLTLAIQERQTTENRVVLVFTDRVVRLDHKMPWERHGSAG